MNETFAPSEGPKMSTPEQRGFGRKLIRKNGLEAQHDFLCRIHRQYTGLKMEHFRECTYDNCERFISFLISFDWKSFWARSILDIAPNAGITTPDQKDITKTLDDFNEWIKKSGVVNKPLELQTIPELEKTYNQVLENIDRLQNIKSEKQLTLFLHKLKIKRAKK